MMSSVNRYAPPPNAPPRLPLIESSTTPRYTIDLEKLSNKGWATLPITNVDPLYSVFSELFDSSARFFDLPESERSKYRVTQPGGGASQVSEEGYSRVEGEKSMFALRKAQTTPTRFELRERAEKAWRESANLMRETLKAIEESLGMSEGALMGLTEKQLELPGAGEGNVATLIRMFRYDRPSLGIDARSQSKFKEIIPSDVEGDCTGTNSRVVSEPHRDLGLLTLVLGHSPGLECWDAELNDWVSCETKQEGLNATLLVGQTLTKFTNGRFIAGRHRVFVQSQSQPSTSTNADSSPLSNPSYRFSLVHALRGHLPVRISHTSFQTAVTGPFPPPLHFSNVTVGEVYQAINDAHWNVNLSVEERRRQERTLWERQRNSRSVEREGEGENGKEDKRRRLGKGRRFSRILDVFRRSPRQSTKPSATAT